jgi:peptidylprolyl isomerase
MLIAGLLAMFAAQGALAQGGGGGQRPPPEPPEPSVAPIRVESRAAPVMSVIAPPIAAENSWVLDLSTAAASSSSCARTRARPCRADQDATRRGFYDGLIFHRVIEGFMAQGGDPQGTGNGSSELPDLAAEFNDLPHLRGAVAMARAEEPDSANSQFYIMFVPRMSMDRKYTVFGRVVSGMEHVDKIQRGVPAPAPTRIVRASIGSDNAPPPTAAEIAAANRPPAPAPGAAAPLRALDIQSLTGAPPASAPAPQTQQQTPPAGASPSPQP